MIYEVNPRTFSETGDFHGIEQRLDYLKDLGVTVVWIMPVHPVGQAKKEGSIGSAYAVQDYYAINPSYGRPRALTPSASSGAFPCALPAECCNGAKPSRWTQTTGRLAIILRTHSTNRVSWNRRSSSTANPLN